MPVEIRAATDADLPAVLDVIESSMQLGLERGAQDAFFRWKHLDNAYGRSPMWVAVVDGRILAFRAFLRWEYVRDGETVRAVRAVDTATHPDGQGQGLFTKLTMHAVEEARAEGIAFVFNTPNTSSRPGYLKMGWHDVGRVPIRMRPRSIVSLARMASAAVPADLWSEPSTAGIAAIDAFADGDEVERLLSSLVPSPSGALRTNRTPSSLAWRYGFEALAYRVELIGGALRDGAIVFRLRRRGGALEAAVTDVLAPPRRAGAVRRALRRVLHDSSAHYAVTTGAGRSISEGLVPVPNRGPRLTWRAVCDDEQPPLAAWDLSLGDVELF